MIHSKNILDFLSDTKITAGHGEARRLIQLGGIWINGEKLFNINYVLQEEDFPDGEIVIKKGRRLEFRIKKEDCDFS